MPKKPTTQPTPQPEPEAVDVTIGRPTSYLPEYARVATALCTAGATDLELSECFGVSERTVNRWKLTHPEFAQACKAGKNEPDERVQRSLFHRAMGMEYEKAHPIKVKKITYDDKGKKVLEEERVEVVMVKEIIPPDTTAMIFWLKNRRALEWRDVHKHEHGRAGEFDNMTLEELKAKIVEEVGEMGLLPPPEPEPKSGRKATKH